jgi:hypothetical protein
MFATKLLEDRASFTLLITLLAIRFTAYYVTLVGLSLFTWRVFGAHSHWRKGLTGLLSVTAESFAYYRRLRKRQRIGLASSIVTNRLAVWGTTAGTSSLVLVGIFLVSVVRNVVPGEDPLSSALISAAGLINGLGWWLTFMPPVWYTRWVERSGREFDDLDWSRN